MGHHADLRHLPGIRPAEADRARAVLAVMLVALAPDGNLPPPVMTRLRVVAAGAPVLAALGPAAVEELAVLTLRSLALRGPDRVLGDLRGLIAPRLAETALALAVRASQSQGRIDARTAGILGGLAAYFAIPPATLADILSVLAMLDGPAD